MDDFLSSSDDGSAQMANLRAKLAAPRRSVADMVNEASDDFLSSGDDESLSSDDEVDNVQAPKASVAAATVPARTWHVGTSAPTTTRTTARQSSTITSNDNDLPDSFSDDGDLFNDEALAALDRLQADMGGAAPMADPSNAVEASVPAKSRPDLGASSPFNLSSSTSSSSGTSVQPPNQQVQAKNSSSALLATSPPVNSSSAFGSSVKTPSSEESSVSPFASVPAPVPVRRPKPPTPTLSSSSESSASPHFANMGKVAPLLASRDYNNTLAGQSKTSQFREANRATVATEGRRPPQFGRSAPEVASNLITTAMGIPKDTGAQALVMRTSNAAHSQYEQMPQVSRGDMAPREHMASEQVALIDSDQRTSEIHSSFYVPPPYVPRPEPLVHHFSPTNRPVRQRRRLPVSQIFQAPVDRLWQGKFDTFNQLQSEIANTLAFSDDNVVVSAPTGAGKTAVFEMAMARFFAVDLQVHQPSTNRQQRVGKTRKIVYIAPSKALCEERFNDWSTRLSAMSLGLEVALVTGDGDPGESYRDVATSHLILTTPEKFDSLTRKWTENFFLFSTFKLVLIDECHLLADESRGCCLESVVCRLKTMQRAASNVTVTPIDIEASSYQGTSPGAINAPMRFVAVSATLPNISDIAMFLGAGEAYTFDESYRPVPLTIRVIGQGFLGENGGNQFRFWNSLNRNVPEIILRFSQKRPTIVFCHSKADTEKLADLLATSNGICLRGNGNQGIAAQTRNSKLQRVLYSGIAYHHAGLDVDDRRVVERAFAGGKIRALCATSTLAMGVNLPAHLVIIKGTKAWRGGGSGYQDIDQASLLQMIGRAGRPGFDTSGTAVIMTDNQSKSKFERLASSGLPPANSQLSLKLDEIINAEISQRVITGTESATNWLKSTLYFVQVQRDPTTHGVQIHSAHSIDAHLLRLCQQSIQRLETIGVLDQGDGQTVSPLAASHIMSQHLVDYQAMQLVHQLPFDSSQRQVLQTLSEIEGLHRPVRRSEKKTLNETHQSIKYKLHGPPSKVRVQDPCQKAFVLLQAAIGQVHLEDFTLRQEMGSMVDYSRRMLAAVEEYSVQGTKNGRVAIQSLRLRRSFVTNLWSGHDGVLGQLGGIGPTTVAALKFNGIVKFEDVLAATDDVLETAAQRSQPFGANLRSVVGQILNSAMKLTAEVEYVDGSNTPCTLHCRLERRSSLPDSTNAGPSSTTAPAVNYTLIAFTDRPGGLVLYKRDLSAPVAFKVDTPARFGKIFVSLVASLAGLDENLELIGNTEVTTSSFLSGKAPPTKAKATKKIRNTQSQIPLSKSKQPKEASKTIPIRQDQQLAPKARNVSITPSPKLPPSSTAPTRALSTSCVTHGAAPYFTHQQPSRAAATAAARGTIHPQPHKAHIQTVQLFRQPPVESSEVLPSQYASTGRGNDWTRGSKRPNPANTCAANNPTKRAFTEEHNGSNHSSVVTRQSGFVPRSQSTPPPSWRHASKEQQRSQQRAFTRKQDNPFRMFAHDPNNAESQLDILSSQSQSVSPHESIIPPNERRSLEQAYGATPAASSRRIYGAMLPQQSRTRSAVRGLPQTGRDVFAMKADAFQQTRLQSQPTAESFRSYDGSPGTQWSSTTNYASTAHCSAAHARASFGSPSFTLQHPAQHISQVQPSVNSQFSGARGQNRAQMGIAHWHSPETDAAHWCPPTGDHTVYETTPMGVMGQQATGRHQQGWSKPYKSNQSQPWALGSHNNDLTEEEMSAFFF